MISKSSKQDLWPYCSGSGIIDRDLAAAIRKWALTGSPPIMSEAELHQHSQRQLLSRYLNEHLRPTLDRIVGRQIPDEESEATARALLENGDPTPADVIAAIKQRSCNRG